jgi:hypothetical protein
MADNLPEGIKSNFCSVADGLFIFWVKRFKKPQKILVQSVKFKLKLC